MLKKITHFFILMILSFFTQQMNAQTETGTLSTNAQTTTTVTTKKIPSEKKVSRIGLVAGLGFSKGRFVADGTDDFNNSMKNLTTGSAMFFWESGKSEHFVTQVGLGYSGKGFKADGRQLNMHYIELPIIMNFRMSIAGPVYLMAGFGPNFSLAFAGKEKIDGVTSRDILEYRVGVNANQARSYNPVDFGLIFNGCVEINLPEGKIIEVGANYKLGLNKVSNKTIYTDETSGSTLNVANPGYKTGVLSITVAYLFNRLEKK